MPRLILLIAVVAVLYILLRRVASKPPHLRRNEYLKVGTGAAVVAVVLLTLAGKMHWIGAAFTGLLVAARQSLPVLARLFPLLGSLGNRANAQPRQSTVSTAILRMHLDHESGTMSGEVLEGPLQNWRLDELDRDQLDTLREYCEERDAESLQLLDGYLQQRADTASAGADKETVGATTSGGMGHKEALEVLGLEEAADRDAVIAAHRKLMQKLHPDRGGSDYLAAKINQAKDLLLEE
ncbi:MAG: hypothetical protein ACI87W_000164 [Halieaceae bacterium]|jgi:hypothetical protein